MHRLPIALAALLLTLTSAAQEAAAPTVAPAPQAIEVTVDLTASATTGVCPATMNLSWTAQNASTCTKSGGWSGNAPASGSEQVGVNSANVTFTLTCSSAIDSRTVTWVNPTQSTSGTAITLKGNKLFHSNSASTVESSSQVIVLEPATTTYLLSGLPAGPRYIGVKATSIAGLDSAMSALANTTITLPTGTDSVQLGCTQPPAPKPPTAVTIAMVVWETIRTGGGLKVGRDVGNVELDVACVGEAPVIVQGPNIEYWVVPKASTVLYRKPKSNQVVGRCDVKNPA